MADRRHFTAEQIANALTETKGMVYIAAKKLGCSHQTIYNYILRHPTVRIAKENAEGEVLDMAELTVFKAIQNGESWAVTFVLKTKGKNRGYVERMENANVDIDLSSLTESQLIRLANGEDVYSVLTAKG
jgi:hypothetical protein